MSESEKQVWTTNIVDLMDKVAAVMGHETVSFVLGNYGADSIDDLDEGSYHSVFSDLAAIEANLG